MMKFSFIEQNDSIVVVELDSPNFQYIELRIKFDDLGTFHVRVNDTDYILHQSYTPECTRELFGNLTRAMDKLAKAKDKKLYALVISCKEDIREILTFHELGGPEWLK